MSMLRRRISDINPDDQYEIRFTHLSKDDQDLEVHQKIKSAAKQYLRGATLAQCQALLSATGEYGT